MVNAIILEWPRTECWPNRSKGKHWTVLGKARKKQRQDAELHARSVGLKLPEGPVVAVLSVHPPTRRRYDLDNLLAAMKAAIDGLVTAADRDDSDIIEVRVRKCSVASKSLGGYVAVGFEPDDGSSQAW